MRKIALKTHKPVAVDSPDHIQPFGTTGACYRNPLFNRKLWALFEGPVCVLDIGCAGGGFVHNCFEDGHSAVGIEGSDFNFVRQAHFWPMLRDVLFTCDATAPFELVEVNEDGTDEVPLAFDVVTSWEVIEHIRTEDLPMVCENVKRRLKPGGLWITSVSPNEEIVNGVVLHQTVQQEPWWDAFFRAHGFVNHRDIVTYFGNDWVRGHWQKAPRSFNFVLSVGESVARIPAVSPLRSIDLEDAVVHFTDDRPDRENLDYAQLLLERLRAAVPARAVEFDYLAGLAFFRQSKHPEAHAAVLRVLAADPAHEKAKSLLSLLDSL